MSHNAIVGAFELIANRLRFTEVPASASIPPDAEVIDNHLDNEPQPERTDPMARAHRTLVRELSRLHVPAFPLNPTGDDFDDVADYIRRVCALFDVTWLQAVGDEVSANAICRVDTKMFSEQFYGAIDGNATYELERCAEAAREAGANYISRKDRDRAVRAEIMRGE